MYKDKDKQREANRKAQAKFKAKAKGITSEGITATIERDMIEAGFEPVYDKPKRGLAIKCFEDLPRDVQQTIRRMSDSNEEFQKRTAIAIKYQHLFPDRYHSTGAAQ